MVFQFKQFSVAQGKCAMKVNTDGVLLGAWQHEDSATTILDIGTGTGVIALMAAQKNDVAIIDAIDIDEDAFAQSSENFKNSLWNNRLTAHHTALQQFQPMRLYDLIISNPPYFIDDQKNESPKKNIARHSITLTYTELLAGINRLMSADGKALIALPVFNLSLFKERALSFQLFVTSLIEVTAVEGKPPYLVLIQLQRKATTLFKSSITIQTADGIFTDTYKALTKEFYLKF